MATASRPTGTFNGMATLATNPIRMIVMGTKPMTGFSQIPSVGFMAMKVIAIPARVPSMAALGVIRLI